MVPLNSEGLTAMLQRMAMLEGNWEVLGPVIGFIAVYILLQSLVLACGCFRPPRPKKCGYHVMNNIGPRFIAVTVVTGDKKVSSLRGGKVILNLRTSVGQILELDLDKCQRHDHGIFTCGRRDTFYIGYHPSERPKMDLIGLSVVPYQKAEKTRWTCEYVFMQDSDGNRGHFFVDHSFFCFNGFADSVYVNEDVNKCRLLWRTLFHGISAWHLWINGFRLDALLWQRILPLYLALGLMAATLSMSQGTYHIVEIFPWSLAASLGATVAIIILEYIFRRMHAEDRAPCYCSNNSVRQVVRPLQYHRKRFISRGTEAAFRKCVRFSEGQGTQTCPILKHHLPGSSERSKSNKTEFIQKHLDGLKGNVEVFAVNNRKSPYKATPDVTFFGSSKNNSGQVGQFVKEIIQSSMKKTTGYSCNASANNSETEAFGTPSVTEDGKERPQSKNDASGGAQQSITQHGDGRETNTVAIPLLGTETSSAEFLIKELIQQTLADPAAKHPSQDYSSATILDLVREEMEISVCKDKNYDQLLQQHLISVIKDLHAALVHAGDLSTALSRYGQLVSAKSKAKQEILDLLDLLTEPAPLPQSEDLISELEDNEQREACSDGSLEEQHQACELHHTSCDLLLNNSCNQQDDIHSRVLSDNKLLKIKSSLSAFSSLRSQLVLETVCDHVKKDLSARRGKLCQKTCNADDNPKTSGKDSSISLSRKASAVILLDDIHDSAMSMSRGELNKALMRNFEGLWLPENANMVQNVVKDLLHGGRKDFAEQFVDNIVDTLNSQKRLCLDPSSPRSRMINQETNWDPSSTSSILKLVTDLFEKELNKIEKTEEAVCKFAETLQYIDTVVTNALIQADASIQHGMACFNDIRNNSNNSNIGSKPGTLKYNLLYNIVSKMAEDHSFGNFSKILFAELSARPVSNYIVYQALARAKDYVYETSNTFDLEQLSRHAAQLCLLPNYNAMTLKDAMDADDFISNITHELEKTAVHFGCQVVAEQLLDFFKHDDATDALRMADWLTRMKGGTLSSNYIKLANGRKSSKEELKHLCNFFDGCMSHEELKDIFNDLEGIRNINQNQRNDGPKPVAAQSANKIDDLDIECGTEWGSLKESRWLSNSSVVNGKEYWKFTLYQKAHDRMLHPATGDILLCFVILTSILILWFLLWVGISNSFSITYIWAKVALIIVGLHICIFEPIKIIFTSIFRVWLIKGPLR